MNEPQLSTDLRIFGRELMNYGGWPIFLDAKLNVASGL